jgi:hypothetical protein
VQCEVEDSGPGCASLFPDEDFAIVGGGCEDVTVLRVSPGDRPYCSFVSAIRISYGKAD